MDTLDTVITSNSKHVYIIDGKEWIVGEQKISKWSKAKCNKDSDKDLKEDIKKLDKR